MMNIQELDSSDLEECAKLYVDVFNGEPWKDSWSIETAYKRLENIVNSPSFVGLKYMEDGRITGALFGNLEQWFEGMHYTLREMFVLTELQGSGIGNKLFKHLEAVLKEKDVRTVLLFTSKGNLTSQFYLKNGFMEYEDMAMMGKDI